MQVLCIRTCFDSETVTPYHAGDLVKISDKTLERWKEQTILQHFGDEETGAPLLVLPPKPEPMVIGGPLTSVKLDTHILADAQKKADEIIAAAQVRAEEILAEAVAVQDTPPRKDEEDVVGTGEDTKEAG